MWGVGGTNQWVPNRCKNKQDGFFVPIEHVDLYISDENGCDEDDGGRDLLGQMVKKKGLNYQSEARRSRSLESGTQKSDDIGRRYTRGGGPWGKGNGDERTAEGKVGRSGSLDTVQKGV